MDEITKVEVSGSAYINWMYPDAYDDNPKDFLDICLYSVRAADSIRIKYDMGRDGWVVLMERTKDHEDVFVKTDHYDEMAFIPAWNTKND